MNLGSHRALDALCGAYLLGTLRGGARRRFESALRADPRVALRLRTWQQMFSVKPAERMAVPLDLARGWARLEGELQLASRRLQPAPWWQRAGFWRGWAIAATGALLLGVAVLVMQPADAPQATIAQLKGEAPAASVTAALSRDRRTLHLQAARPVLAGPSQSYELWLIPAEGGAPISLAVLGQLDARIELPAAQVGRVRSGAKLAVSVEPAGGSPTGAPTGPVILIGEVQA